MTPAGGRQRRAASGRELAAIALGALGAALVTWLVWPVAGVILNGLAMYRDARGMVVEPPWAGHLATAAAVALVGGGAGFTLGWFAELRWSRGALAGALGAAFWIASWYALRLAQGSPMSLASVDAPGAIAVMSLMALTSAVGTRWGARSKAATRSWGE